MEVKEFYARLRREGIWVKVEKETLQLTGPSQAITADLVQIIKTHKNDLIDFLNGSSRALPELRKVENKEFYEMQFIQRGRYAMYRVMGKCRNPNMTNEIDAFNISFSIVLKDMDVLLFKRAFASIVERHEFLRTTFSMVEERPVQVIHGFYPFLNYLEHGQLGRDGDSDVELESLVMKHKTTSFNFETGPLFKATLLERSKSDFVFLFTMNHIIGDFSSVEAIKREFMDYYDMYKSGKEMPLAEVKLQPRDFAAWEDSILASTPGLHMKKFWTTELIGINSYYPLQNLYSDAASIDISVRSYKENFRDTLNENFAGISDKECEAIIGLYHRAQSRPGSLVRTVIHGQTYRDAKTLCNRLGISMFTLLTATLNLLSCKISRRTQAVIGLHLTNRLMHPDLAGISGCMSNTALFKSDIDDNDLVDQYLKATQQRISDLYQYSLYPFERVLHDLDIALDAIGGIYINYIDASALAGSEIRDVSTQYQAQWGICFFELDFNITEHKNGLDLSCRYRKDLFDQTTVLGILESFETMLQMISSSSRDMIKDLLTFSAYQTEPGKAYTL